MPDDDIPSQSRRQGVGRPEQIEDRKPDLTKQRSVLKRAAIVLFGLLAVLLGAFATLAWYSDWSVRADESERVRALSGDELIPKPIGSVTHAVTIRRSAHDIWPWLAQMGSGRRVVCL